MTCTAARVPGKISRCLASRCSRTCESTPPLNATQYCDARGSLFSMVPGSSLLFEELTVSHQALVARRNQLIRRQAAQLLKLFDQVGLNA